MSKGKAYYDLSKICIEDNIPVSRRPYCVSNSLHCELYDFLTTLKVGQSFEITVSRGHGKKFRSAILNASRRNKMNYKTRTVSDNTIRVWRVEDNEVNNG